MSTLFRTTNWVLFWLFAPASLVFLIVGTIIASPAGLSISVPIALVYGAAWVFLFRFSAMWPKAGAKWVIATLGAGVGTCGAVLLVAGPVSDLVEKLGWEAALASFAGAYPEEILKASCIVVILLGFRELDRPWHGLITGAMVGLGFELYENVMYGSTGALLDPNTDVEGALTMWGLRIVAGPGLHIMFSALAGWGIGVGLFSARLTSARRWLAAGGSTALAFALHFGWNFMPGSPVLQVVGMVAVALVGYPLVIWLAIKGHRAAKEDLKVRPQWHAALAARQPRRG